MAVALFMAQAACGGLGDPRAENWRSYPDGNVKAEWSPDGRSMKLLEIFRYIDAKRGHMNGSKGCGRGWSFYSARVLDVHQRSFRGQIS